MDQNAEPVVTEEGSLADGVIAALQDKVDQPKIDAILKKLQANAQAYPANGLIISFVLFTKVQVMLKDGSKSFTGYGGGLATPGGGPNFGDVYTDDFNKLCAETDGFVVITTPVYLTVLFLDKDLSLLGHYQSGAISTAGAQFSGAGHWS